MKEFTIGSLWRTNFGSGELYMLAQVEPTAFALISLKNGNRFSEPVSCKPIFWGAYNNFKFTEEEWNLITDNQSFSHVADYWYDRVAINKY